MFVPKKFAVEDLSALDDLVARDAFVTLVSQVDGAPFASHLPVLYRRDGARVRFSGHWARANPQWRGIDDQRVLLIVHGAHAYVSPTWYADPATNVPTWNYAVAHVHGRLELIHDPDRLSLLVADLSEKYEAALGSSWRFPGSAPTTRRELAGIIGFELDADTVQIKHKLNQHHDDDSVEGAITGLRATGAAQSADVAGLMEQSLRQRQERRRG